MSSINKPRGRKPMRKSQRILALLEKGHSPAAIAKSLKTSVSYVYVIKSKAAAAAPAVAPKPARIDVPVPTAPVAAPVATPVAAKPVGMWAKFRDWIGV